MRPRLAPARAVMRITRFYHFDIGRLLAICSVLWSLAGVASAQPSPGQIDPVRTPVLSPHFEPELAFDAPVVPQRWDEQTPGLHAAFGSTDRIYFRSEVPAVD